jgi:hypothetical protein
VQKIESRVLGASGNGAVILMHSTNAQTVAALPGIIEKLRARGYEFMTMSEWEAAAAGKPLQPQNGKVPLVSPSGAPPSFREIEGMPELPELPGSGPGLLAVSEEPHETALVADPKWVEATEPEFDMPAEPEPALAGKEVPPEAEPPLAKAVATATLPDAGLPLFIFGNFAEPKDAEAIFAGDSGKKIQRSR